MVAQSTPRFDVAQRFSLKDQLFNRNTVSHLGDLFDAAGVFKAAPFVKEVMAEMLPLELKARINLIADVLARHLPQDFPSAVAAILSAMPPPLDPTKSDNDFGQFIYAPLGVYVERHGMDDVRDSLDLLGQLTQRFSMEFSIRAFLNSHEAAVLERMQDWVAHDHYHVRRLVSEGTRPRLPWGQNVGLSIAQTLPLLDRLHSDPTRFVVRSVANHLNDITKKDPGVALSRLADWRESSDQDPKELEWLTRHALRGLVKAGHSGAMAHLGYSHNIALTNAQIDITPEPIARGETSEILVEITSETTAPLIVDFVIDFVKASGATAPKVFKYKMVKVEANVPLILRKKYHFKDDATTFILYPGGHKLHLQINGRIVATRLFTLA